MSAVQSYNEWDPLEEVIVGIATGAVQRGYEPGLAPYAHRDSPERRDTQHRPFPAEDVERAEAQLDGLADRLEKEGVVVRRPEPIDQAQEIVTPDFRVSSGYAQTCPRDVLLVVGDEIIEASMAQRSRFFEYRAYRPLVRRYFESGARWTAMPKPLMRDDQYELDYSTEDGPYDFATHANLTEVDPACDAACFMRCGRDIFWQPDIVSNGSGATWLQRHLGPEYRVHKLEFVEKDPEHLDTTFVPLRPGLALINPDRPFKDDMGDFFARAGWRLVEPPPSVYDVRSGAHARGVSWWISLNILSLDPETVIVEASEEPLIELLGELGFDTIALEFESVYRFGGSFHCCTLDVRRTGGLESYFAS